MKRILNILCVSLLCLGYWGCSADESTENPRSVTTLETAEQAVIATREGLTTYFTVTSNSGGRQAPGQLGAHHALERQQRHDDRRPDGGPRIRRPAPRRGRVLHLGEQRRAIHRPGLPDEADRPGGVADVVPTIGKEGTTLTFTVASHNEYDVDTNCDWITGGAVRRSRRKSRSTPSRSRPTRGADAAPGSPSRARRRTFRPR